MVKYKGFSQQESDEMSRIFNSGSTSELDGLLKKLNGRRLERDTSVPAYTGPLFHGTTDPGVAARGQVLPARQFGRASYNKAPDSSMQRPEDYAFATEREGTAWSYAAETAHQTGERAYVVKVEPRLEMEKGVHHHNNREWRSDRFDVTERMDTRPGHQGTIPQVNWNTYKTRDASRFYDANHPDQDEVAKSTAAPFAGSERRTEFESSVREHHGQQRLF